MTRPIPEDGQLCVIPEGYRRAVRSLPVLEPVTADSYLFRQGDALAFPGGAVDTSSFVESHNGPTPTTLTPAYREPSRQERGLAFLKLAQINIAEALDTASAFERKFCIVASKTCIEQALELLK